MMQNLHKLVFFPLLIVLLWGTSRFCHKQTDGFQIVKIISDIPILPKWETPPASNEEFDALKTIFQQPFFYLSSGGQCYAFVSKDGKLVLKLFKMHNIRQYSWLYRISLPGSLDRFRIELIKLQKQKLERVFTSSQVAYVHLKEVSGLLFLNLNPNAQFENLKITLIDKIGIEHSVNLAHIPFALQYKADKVFPTLRMHLGNKDIQAGKKVIKKVVECLKARYKKGIIDLDPALRRNIGLLEDRAITIDIGSFLSSAALDTPELRKHELQCDTRRMQRWLLKRSPELAAYLDKLIAEYAS